MAGHTDNDEWSRARARRRAGLRREVSALQADAAGEACARSSEQMARLSPSRRSAAGRRVRLRSTRDRRSSGRLPPSSADAPGPAGIELPDPVEPRSWPASTSPATCAAGSTSWSRPTAATATRSALAVFDASGPGRAQRRRRRPARRQCWRSSARRCATASASSTRPSASRRTRSACWRPNLRTVEGVQMAERLLRPARRAGGGGGAADRDLGRRRRLPRARHRRR